MEGWPRGKCHKLFETRRRFEPFGKSDLPVITIVGNSMHVRGFQRLMTVLPPRSGMVMVGHGIENVGKPLGVDPIHVYGIKPVSGLVQNVNPVNVGTVQKDRRTFSEIAGNHEGQVGVGDSTFQAAGSDGHHVEVAIHIWIEPKEAFHF
jgi:hypothetical protein